MRIMRQTKRAARFAANSSVNRRLECAIAVDCEFIEVEARALRRRGLRRNASHCAQLPLVLKRYTRPPHTRRAMETTAGKSNSRVMRCREIVVAGTTCLESKLTNANDVESTES